MKRFIKNTGILLFLVVVAASCQKMDRPALGDYPSDQNQPLLEGPLRFYVNFDGTDGATARWNVYDSISSNPALNLPGSLELVPGVKGNSLRGADNAAILYLNANDFKQSTSFTIAFWMKREVNNRTEFYFSLKDDTYGWIRSSITMLMEHTTESEATVKLVLMDQWLEFAGDNKLKRPLFDGNWHHFAMAYDETTSRITYYVDGSPVAEAPEAATLVKKDGNPRGKLDLSKSDNLVIGGANKNASLPGPTDGWLNSFLGDMDQFRMYNKALTGTEVKQLFDNRQ